MRWIEQKRVATVANRFRAAAEKALADEALQSALQNAKAGFVDKRREALEEFPDFAAVQDSAIAIKNHTLSKLDAYLEEFEQNVQANGAQVHWASSTEEANQIIVDICQQANAKRITKGKSMVSEEMALNHALEAAGYQVRETDLGEYIIQLAEETPSHIVAPAMHKTKQQVEDLFSDHHQHAPDYARPREEIVDEARQKLREDFLSADVGITGANFLIADSGSTVIVTNEGNGDLTASLPDVHIVTAGIEKVIPRLSDLPSFLRLLARSATGQAMTAYTTIFSGPKRSEDLCGPKAFHVVLLDNGRSQMLGSPFHDALRCIRCGACMNHCAVYQKIGGHAYDAVYPGPIGQVLMHLLHSERKNHLGMESVDACTMNGHCEVVCPMRIPLSQLIREHRMVKWQKASAVKIEKLGLRGWAMLTARPMVYSKSMALARFFTHWGARIGLNRLISPILKPVNSRINSAWLKTRELPTLSSCGVNELLAQRVKAEKPESVSGGREG